MRFMPIVQQKPRTKEPEDSGYIFNLSTNHFKHRMSNAMTADGKYDITCELAGLLIHQFSLTPRKIRELTYISKSVVMTSTGIAPGYRLSDTWFPSVIAQITMCNDVNTDNEDVKAKLKKLWERNKLGDIDEALNPEYKGFDILHPIEYYHSYDPVTGEKIIETVFVVLKPNTQYPIGSEWVSNDGGIYRVSVESEKSVYFIDYSTGKDIMLPKRTIKNWTRLV